MTALHAIVLAIVQGITELFPVSSLGHAVILPALLKWRDATGQLITQSEAFLPFLVVMHLGTAVALLAFFWRDWFDFAMAVLVNRGSRAQAERRVFWRVVAATIPAVIFGALLEKLLRQAFASAVIASAFLIVNGFILFAAERLKGAPRKRLAQLGWIDALVIGLFQCLALIPGVSRSGATMVGGLLTGLDHEESARFSFLAATPIILAATVKEAPKILKGHTHISSLAILAGVISGVVAFVSIWALMRWFKRHEFKALDPFAVYCWVAGAASLAILLFVRP